MAKVFNWLSGRTTSFLVFFTISGTALHIWHRLDGTYITFVGVIMGFVLSHSVKDDVSQFKGVRLTSPGAKG